MSGYIIDLRLRVESDTPPYPDAGERIAAILSRDAGVIASLRAPVIYLGGYTTTAPERPKVTIRPHTYRDTPGYSVRSSGGERIFVHTREAAERCKARLLNGEEVRGEDMD